MIEEFHVMPIGVIDVTEPVHGAGSKAIRRGSYNGGLDDEASQRDSLFDTRAKVAHPYWKPLSNFEQMPMRLSGCSMSSCPVSHPQR